jgi:hypothetical protein
VRDEVKDLLDLGLKRQGLFFHGVVVIQDQEREAVAGENRPARRNLGRF